MKNKIIEYFQDKKLTNSSVDKFLKENQIIKRVFDGYTVRNSGIFN
jgi:hypothetical protein